MDAETAVVAGAGEADEDAEFGRGPLRRWGGAVGAEGVGGEALEGEELWGKEGVSRLGMSEEDRGGVIGKELLEYKRKAKGWVPCFWSRCLLPTSWSSGRLRCVRA